MAGQTGKQRPRRLGSKLISRKTGGGLDSTQAKPGHRDRISRNTEGPQNSAFDGAPISYHRADQIAIAPAVRTESSSRGVQRTIEGHRGPVMTWVRWRKRGINPPQTVFLQR